LHWLAACGKTLSLLPQNKIEGLNDLAPGGKSLAKQLMKCEKQMHMLADQVHRNQTEAE